MRIRFFIFLFLFFFKNLTAQVGGEEVYQFLNIATSARQVALGGEVLTLVDDVSQPIWNPATITNEIDRELAVNYTSYLAGVSIGSASFAYTFNNRFGTMNASIKYLNYGSLIAADENGNETGSFNASDIALSIIGREEAGEDDTAILNAFRNRMSDFTPQDLTYIAGKSKIAKIKELAAELLNNADDDGDAIQLT